MDSSSILSFPVSEVDLRNDIIKKLNEIIDYFEQENIQTIPSNNEMIKFAVNQISNVDIEICSKALHALMEITYKGKNYIQVVIDAGGIEPLRGCLKSENQMLVCFATYTLHKVTNGTVEHKEAVVNARIIPILIQLLTSSDDHILSQAMATISNLLVCESGKFVEVVVEAGAIENIVKLLESENSFIIFNAVVSLIFSKYTEEIIRAGAIPALFEILELSEDDATCDVTEQLLATLAEVDDSIVIDSLDILVSENWMICKHAARILSLIAQDSPNNINLMIKNGVIQKIVQLFQSSDVNRQKAGGFLVKWIADNEEHIQPIIDAGIIPCLVRLLENGEQQNTVHLFHKTDIFDFSKSDICDIAASDICMIALGNSEQKELVIQSGCIPLLIKLLKSTNQDVRHSAINAILGISECSTIEQKQVLIDDGILPFVVELLLDPKLCQFATEVLANIAKKDTAQVQAIIDANAIPSLIKVLDSPDSDTRESAALVFYFMTCAMDETYNYVVTKTRALPYLVKILEMNDINDYTIVLPMLVNITFGSDEDVEAVVNANTIPSIVKFLGSSETDIVKEILSTIANIVWRSEENAKAVIDSGALPQILKFLESNIESVCEEATRVIQCFTMGTANFIQVILDYGSLPTLLKLLNGSNESIIENIVTAICFMSDGSLEQRQAFISHGLITSFVDFLDSSCQELINSVTRTFMHLSAGNVKHKQAIIDANVVPKLIKHFSSKYPCACECSLTIIANLADGTKDQIQYIVESGVIPHLINYLQTSKKYTECAIKSLANIAEGTIEHKKAVLNAGALEPLNELSKSADQKISRPAQRAIYNLSNCKEELLPSSFLTSKM